VFGPVVRAKTFIAAAALVAVAAAGVVVGSAATAAPPTASRSVVLGKTANYPVSGCPKTQGCEVTARVTGIQMRADGVEHPFRAPSSGQIVAWWLKLPELRRSQIRSFSDLFGGGPAARIAVLRRGKQGRVRLIRQSPTEDLRSHLGAKGRVRFRLLQPLRVKEGDYVGLTSITWVPAFAVGLDPAGDAWLASRPERRCDTPSSQSPERFARYYKRNDAHAEASTVKQYRCLYRTARLLYWARLVPDETSPEPDSEGNSSPRSRR
jgi:hypothetical protein